MWVDLYQSVKGLDRTKSLDSCSHEDCTGLDRKGCAQIQKSVAGGSDVVMVAATISIIIINIIVVTAANTDTLLVLCQEVI